MFHNMSASEKFEEENNGFLDEDKNFEVQKFVGAENEEEHKGDESIKGSIFKITINYPKILQKNLKIVTILENFKIQEA